MRLTESALRRIVREEFVRESVRNGKMTIQEGRRILSEKHQVIFISPNNLKRVLFSNRLDQQAEILKAGVEKLGLNYTDRIYLAPVDDADIGPEKEYAVTTPDGTPIGVPSGLKLKRHQLGGGGIYDPNVARQI